MGIKFSEMSLFPAVLIILSFPFFAYFIVFRLQRRRLARKDRPSATLVVTQTPGNHSPRAHAHASAVLESKVTEAVIFVAQFPPPPPHSNIHFVPISTPPHYGLRHSAWSTAIRLLHLAQALIKSLRAASSLPFSVRYIIINTPPILPTLPLLAFFRPLLFPWAHITLDVHNLGFTLMRLTSSPFVVYVATIAEAFSIHLAHNHWTVSVALSDYLRENFRVHATVVYDRPRRSFMHCPDGRQLHLSRLLQDHAKLIAPPSHMASKAVVTLDDSLLAYIPLVVSSSSWTPDEDFSLLLQALPLLDAAARPLLLVLTGKGPMRAAYETSVAHLSLKHIAVAFAWLPADDYPRLLSAAAIGICLHASSSGLDLPMKAVDLFAAGTPVLALRYPCIHELVLTNENGFLFDDAISLVELLLQLLIWNPAALAHLRLSIRRQLSDGAEWITSWQRNALPTLREMQH